jgi:hypothetical protein
VSTGQALFFCLAGRLDFLKKVWAAPKIFVVKCVSKSICASVSPDETLFAFDQLQKGETAAHKKELMQIMFVTNATPTARRKRAHVLPEDFGTQPHRLHGTAVYEAALDVAHSTFARWRSEGRVGKPDSMMGKLCKWRESTILKTMLEGVA